MVGILQNYGDGGKVKERLEDGGDCLMADDGILWMEGWWMDGYVGRWMDIVVDGIGWVDCGWKDMVRNLWV